MDKATGSGTEPQWLNDRRWLKATAVAVIMLLSGLGLMVPELFAGSSPDASDIILVAPESSRQNPIPAGSLARVIVLITNAGFGAGSRAGTDASFNAGSNIGTEAKTGAKIIPRLLELVLTGEDGRSVQVSARGLDDNPQPVPPGGYARLAYGFDVPLQMAGGLVTVRAGQPETNTVMFFAGLPRQQAPEPAAEAASESKPVTAMLPKFQPFFVNFYPYKPVYFLFGTDPGVQKTSFQISFKYKLFNFEQADQTSVIDKTFDRIYLAYTQQSFWDLRSDSAPFEDSRYMPEIFYYDDDLGLSLPWLIGSGLQIGLQHESNGRSGDNSRSTNYAYVQPSLIFKFTSRLHWLLAPKAWLYVRNDNDTNGDLADYRGYVDIESEFGDPKGFALGSHLRWGKEGESWQVDLSYPLNRIPGLEGMLDVYVHAQYYTGYSEQLLIYDRKEDIFRLGFSLVR